MLKDEIARMWGMDEVIVIPVVVGALGAVSTGFEKFIAAIGIEMAVEHSEKNSFIGDSKDFETGTWMQKKHDYKYHCARLCETFDNKLLSAVTESAGATSNNALCIIINDDDDDDDDNNDNNNNSCSKFRY